MFEERIFLLHVIHSNNKDRLFAWLSIDVKLLDEVVGHLRGHNSLGTEAGDALLLLSGGDDVLAVL